MRFGRIRRRPRGLERPGHRREWSAGQPGQRRVPGRPSGLVRYRFERRRVEGAVEINKRKKTILVFCRFFVFLFVCPLIVGGQGYHEFFAFFLIFYFFKFKFSRVLRLKTAVFLV